MEPKIDVVELLPTLHLFRFPVGQAYLWRDATGLTLIDSGLTGFGGAVTTAITELELDPRELRRIVLTHFHEDHVGALAELTEGSDIEVAAHSADAPFIRGDQPGPQPNLTDGERAFRDTLPPLPQPPPAPVDTELADGQVLDFGGGAHVLSVPGHTDGSIALFLPEHGVVFTGDTVGEGGGQVVLGPFNLDADQSYRSLQRIAGLDARIACVGHGDPVREDAAARIATAARHAF